MSISMILPGRRRRLRVRLGGLPRVGTPLPAPDGWSPLRTGLSWLFMNGPFLLAAQLTGRLDRRLPVALVIAVGCVAGAAGVFALSVIGPTTPLIVTAVGYLPCGVLVPGITHVAMRDIAADVSGAASGVLNASRQLGTSAGLAVLAALGVASAISNWKTAARAFPLRSGQRQRGRRRTWAEPASAPSPAFSAAPTGSPPPSHSCTGTTSRSASAQPACSPPAVIAVLGFRGQSEAGACSSSSTSMPLGARTFTTR
jgi:hypothetical protein